MKLNMSKYQKQSYKTSYRQTNNKLFDISYRSFISLKPYLVT